MKNLLKLNEHDLIEKSRKVNMEDEIAKRATMYARYAMADIEYALAVLGTALSEEEYQRVFKAMMVRKAKNELRKVQREMD